MTVTVQTTDMFITCLRTNYRYVYDCHRTNYRYVYYLSPYKLQIFLWLSPYQLQICLLPVSVPTTDMSMTCVRTNYRCLWLSPYQLQICLWPVSVPTTDMSMSPYQLQICLWPVSVTATDMSLICPRTNHYTPCSSGPLLIAKPPKTIYMYVRPILTASPQQLHIVLNPIITDHLNDLKSDTPLAFAPH